MRCFFGVKLPSDLQKEISDLSKKIIDGPAKMVSEQNLHITLRFLGETDPTKLKPHFGDFKFDPFSVQLKGIGAFPNIRRPRIVWVGIADGSDSLEELHRRITSTLNLSPDKFHPHVTVARIKSRCEIKEVETEFRPFDVSDFELFSSTLTPSGPVYQSVFSIPS
jgi:2'-5' RNA ligase